jgi:hypothetical protein
MRKVTSLAGNSGHFFGNLTMAAEDAAITRFILGGARCSESNGPHAREELAGTDALNLDRSG